MSNRLVASVLSWFLCLLFLPFAQGAFAQSLNTSVDKQDSSNAAYKYILDYDVPESPAFAILGVSPAKVLRGSAAKPIVLNMLNQLGTSERSQNGVAVDFSPYFIFLGRMKNVSEYRASSGKRVLANSQISFGTVQDKAESTALAFGLGARITLFDSHDLLQDRRLGRDIDSLLLDSIPDAPGPEETTGTGTKLVKVDLSPAYKAARERALRKRGRSMAVGCGLSGRMRSAVAHPDSFEALNYQVWVSYKYSLGHGNDFLSIYQGQFATQRHPEHRLGGAFRKNWLSDNWALEAVYTSSARKVEIGGNAEIKLLSGVSAVVSLSSDYSSGVLPVLRIRTALRWNFSEKG
jgi:hypothetical protein